MDTFRVDGIVTDGLGDFHTLVTVAGRLEETCMAPERLMLKIIRNFFPYLINTIYCNESGHVIYYQLDKYLDIMDNISE